MWKNHVLDFKELNKKNDDVGNSPDRHYNQNNTGLLLFRHIHHPAFSSEIFQRY